MESIPYDKRSERFGLTVKPIGKMQIFMFLTMDYIMLVVFEGERVYDGEIFKLEEHTERLYSAKEWVFQFHTLKKRCPACKNIVNIQKGTMDI